jgi:hypothetical protein
MAANGARVTNYEQDTGNQLAELCLSELLTVDALHIAAR